MPGRRLTTTITITRYNGVSASVDIPNAVLGQITDRQLGAMVRSTILEALQKSARQTAQTAEKRKSQSPKA